MTTSSFERNRCTRISPSAVLDDRLDGKDLEWARDHLRRCESCRERVEDFREMLLRVGRLPSAAVGAAAMDEAFALSIPDRLRTEGGSRAYEIAPAPPVPSAPACNSAQTEATYRRLAGLGLRRLAPTVLITPYASSRLVSALPQEFANEDSYFVITPERPQRIRREAQLFKDWLIAVAAPVARK